MEECKKLRIFPCKNLEIKISMNKQMEEDWINCQKKLDDYLKHEEDAFLPELDFLSDCKNCSWNDIKINNVGICVNDEVMSRVNRELGLKDFGMEVDLDEK